MFFLFSLFRYFHSYHYHFKFSLFTFIFFSSAFILVNSQRFFSSTTKILFLAGEIFFLPAATIIPFLLWMVGRSYFSSKPKLHNSPSNSAIKVAPSSQWIKLSYTPDQPVQTAAKCYIYISNPKSVSNTFLWGSFDPLYLFLMSFHLYNSLSSQRTLKSNCNNLA